MKIKAFQKGKTNKPIDNQILFYRFLKTKQKNEMLKELFLLKKSIAYVYGLDVVKIFILNIYSLL